MGEILVRAFSFILIIVIGSVLRRKGFFKEEDFTVLSKIVLRITLPAAIISSFEGKTVDVSMLLLSLIGLGCGVLYMILSFFLYAAGGKRKQAFAVLNSSGYNIGNCSLPFVQSFLGPVGVITTSLFDIGNAFICLGGAKSIAAAIKGESGGSPIAQIIRSLTKSLAFDCYLVMGALSILKIKLPAAVFSFAGTIGSANAFMAMLMIGVGFHLSGNREQIGMIVKILAVRYAVAAVWSFVFYHYLPFAPEVRHTLAFIVFSPIAAAAPAFTEEIGEDVGLSSAINSISIVIGISCMVFMLGIIA